MRVLPFAIAAASAAVVPTVAAKESASDVARKLNADSKADKPTPAGDKPGPAGKSGKGGGCGGANPTSADNLERMIFAGAIAQLLFSSLDIPDQGISEDLYKKKIIFLFFPDTNPAFDETFDEYDIDGGKFLSKTEFAFLLNDELQGICLKEFFNNSPGFDDLPWVFRSKSSCCSDPDDPIP